jgi:hypothetical protein
LHVFCWSHFLQQNIIAVFPHVCLCCISLFMCVSCPKTSEFRTTPSLCGAHFPNCANLICCLWGSMVSTNALVALQSCVAKTSVGLGRELLAFWMQLRLRSTSNQKREEHFQSAIIDRVMALFSFLIGLLLRREKPYCLKVVWKKMAGVVQSTSLAGFQHVDKHLSKWQGFVWMTIDRHQTSFDSVECVDARSELTDVCTRSLFRPDCVILFTSVCWWLDVWGVGINPPNCRRGWGTFRS